MPIRLDEFENDAPKDADAPVRLDAWQDKPDYNQIEADVNDAAAMSQKHGISMAEARRNINMGKYDESTRRHLINLRKAGFDVEIDYSPLRDQGGLYSTDMTWEDKAMEVSGAFKRGGASLAKSPSVLLKATAENFGLSNTQFGKELKRAAEYNIAYYNGLAPQMSEEMGWLMRGSFTDHPFLRTSVAVGESMPQFGAAAFATILTKSPKVGMLIMGGTSATQSYESLRQEGIEPEIALVGSSLVGSIEMLTEKVPMDLLLKGAGKKYLVRALQLGTAESFQELLANMGQNYVTEKARQVDKMGWEKAVLQARVEWSIITNGWQDVMAAGFLMGGGMAGFTGGPSPDFFNPDVELKTADTTRTQYQYRPSADQAFEDVINRVRQEVKASEQAETLPTTPQEAAIAPAPTIEPETAPVQPQASVEGVEATGKEPWEMTKGEFVKDKDTFVMNNITDNPTTNKYKEGDIIMDGYGENPYIYEMQMTDPKTLAYGLEGMTYEQVVNMPTTQKYIEWYKQGNLPMPITVVKNDYEGNKSTNRRRVIAAIEAGVDQIPAFVEIGRHQDFIKQAIASGKPVPTPVLQEYASEPWAKEELAKREKSATLPPMADKEAPAKPYMQTPIKGTGETVERGLSLSISEKVTANGLADTIGKLPEYQRIRWDDQMLLAKNLYLQDPERAKRVAMYQEASPTGLLPETVITYLVNKAIAEGDIDTLRELGTNEAIASEETTLGQRIRMLGDRNPGLNAVREVAQARKKSAERKGETVISDAEVNELKAKLAEAEKKLADMVIQGEAKKTKARAPRQYGAVNKVVKLTEYQQIMERRKKEAAELQRRGKQGGFVYVPTPQDFADMAKIGLFHLEAVGRDVATWTTNMTKDFGEWASPYLDNEWTKALAVFDTESLKELKSAVAKKFEATQNIQQLTPLAHKIAKHFVDTGISNRDALTDAVHGVLKDIVPDITRRQSMDLISKYGQFTPLDPDEAKATLRDLKGQMQQVAKIEDMQAGQPPKKTGVERRTPSDEERQLIQQVNELKKLYNIETVDPAKQLKSALDEVKTRLNNQIADLEKQIATREKIVKTKTPAPSDPEVVTLKKKRDALRKEFDAIFGKPKLTEAQRAKIAEASVKKSIADLERRIKEKDVAPKAKSKPVQTPELEVLRTDRDLLRIEYELLKDSMEPKLSPEEIALKRLKSRLTNETRRLQDKLARNDFEVKESEPIELDAEAAQMKRQRDSLKEQLKTAQQAASFITDEEVAKLAELARVSMMKREYLETHPESRRERGSTVPTQPEWEYGIAEAMFRFYKADLVQRAEALSIKEQLTEYKNDPWLAVVDVASTMRTAWTAIDNSFVGRQGVKQLFQGMTGDFTALKTWFNTFLLSHKAMYEGARNRNNMILAQIATELSDPDLPLIEQSDVDLGNVEEEIPSDLPQKVMILGVAFRMGEGAFKWSARYMRYQIIKQYLRAYDLSGMTPDEQLRELKGLGSLANAQTGRGHLNIAPTGRRKFSTLFSPRLLKGVFDFYTAHFLDATVPWHLKKRAAMNLFRVVAAQAFILWLANLIDDESVTFDPRDSDFGKIRVGNTRFSVGGGAEVLVVLAARLATNVMVSSTTKKEIELNSGKYGGLTSDKLIWQFFMNKLAPMPSKTIELLNRKTRDGDPVGLRTLLYSFTPLQLQNYFESAPIEDRANMLLIMMAENYGTGANTYEPKKKDNKPKSKAY